MSQSDRRLLLIAALVDFRDSGGPAEDVVWAIQELVEQLILDSRNGEAWKQNFCI